jgi:hypothetical protein
MAARHCRSWWRWWSITLWATLMRLWLHSLLCYLKLLLWRFLCNFINLYYVSDNDMEISSSSSLLFIMSKTDCYIHLDFSVGQNSCLWQAYIQTTVLLLFLIPPLSHYGSRYFAPSHDWFFKSLAEKMWQKSPIHTLWLFQSVTEMWQV